LRQGAGHAHFAAGGLAPAGQHFHQLALAVAGDTGNPDDLAGAQQSASTTQR
jgi:hypothetical protein